MKKRPGIKLLFAVVLAVLIVVLALVAVLPMALSSRAIQVRVLGRVNRSLADGRQVHWEKSSFGWFRGQRLEGFVYRDPVLSLRVDSIQMDKGFFAMLGRQINFGMITIAAPRIEVNLAGADRAEDSLSGPDRERTEGRGGSSRAGGASREPVDGARRQGEAETPAAAFQMPIDIKGMLLVRNGQLQVRGIRGTETASWGNIEMSLDLGGGLQKGVKLEMQAEQFDVPEPGMMELRAFLGGFQPDGTLALDQLKADLVVKLRHIDLGVISGMVGEQSGLPMLRGVLNSEISTEIAGMDHVAISLDLDVTEPMISGGPLGGDRLQPGDTQIVVRGAWRDGVFNIEDARVLNKLLQFSGGGRFEVVDGAAYPVGLLQFAFTTDVARTVMQLPETLRLQDGLVLEDGVLSGSANVDSDGEGMSIRLATELPRIMGRQLAQQLVIDQPVVLNLSARVLPAGLDSADVTIRTGFAHIHGKGNLDDFSGGAEVDLDAARQTFASFMQIDDDAFGGGFTASGRLMKDGENAKRYEVAIKSPGVSFRLKPEQAFVLPAFSVETRGAIDFDQVEPGNAAYKDLRLLLQSDPLKASVHVDAVAMTAAGAAVHGGRLQWDANVAQIMSILSAAGIVSDDIRLSGRFSGGSAIELRDENLAISPFDANIVDLLFQAATVAPITLAGNRRTEFSWYGPVSPEWISVVRDGKGAGRIELDRISAYGMHVTNAVVTMQSEAGRMNLALNTAVNDGVVVIEPVVDVTGVTPWLVVPDNAHVIRDVPLTDEMATELVALIHPLLRGSTVLGGTVSLVLEHCRVPLSEESLEDVTIQGVLVLKDLKLAPRGVLLDIMETAQLKSRTLHVVRQDVAFRVTDGRIHSSPLNLTVDGHDLSLLGSVGLDASLAYTVNVPVTAALFGREAFRLLEGSHVVLQVGGTVTRPEVAADAFRRAIAVMVRDAAENALQQEGREVIRDLQERGEDALRDLLRQHRR